MLLKIQNVYSFAVIAASMADASSKEDTSPFIEFGDDDDDFDVDEARRMQDEEFDFGAMMQQSAADSKQQQFSQGEPDLCLSAAINNTPFYKYNNNKALKAVALKTVSNVSTFLSRMAIGWR